MIKDFPSFILFSFFLYHLIGGVCALGPSKWVNVFSKRLYGLSLNNEDHFFIALKAIGIFALFTSLAFFIIFLSEDSFLRSYFVILAGLLIGLRGVIRFLYRDIFERSFNLKKTRNIKHVCFNIIVALVFFLTGVSELSIT